jgi:FKBP-type peptidyl-prolyl cis-trans isomerase
MIYRRIQFFLFVTLLLGCANKVISTNSGLKYTILTKGTGLKAKSGDEVFIFETTSYLSGTELYSNFNSKTPVKPKLVIRTLS